MKDIHKKIETKAYKYFLERGMAHGNDVGDWLRAEQETIVGNDKKSSKKKTALKKEK